MYFSREPLSHSYSQLLSTTVFVAPQTVARLQKPENTLVNGIISDNASWAAARQSCGAPGSGDKRLTAFITLQYVKCF